MERSSNHCGSVESFQVAADTDRGYQALNTLSGTRLNSKLEDLGASITVITKQQLEDTNSRDLNDVFLYEANTEGSRNYTPIEVNRSGIKDRVGGSFDVCAITRWVALRPQLQAI